MLTSGDDAFHNVVYHNGAYKMNKSEAPVRYCVRLWRTMSLAEVVR